MIRVARCVTSISCGLFTSPTDDTLGSDPPVAVLSYTYRYRAALRLPFVAVWTAPATNAMLPICTLQGILTDHIHHVVRLLVLKNKPDLRDLWLQRAKRVTKEEAEIDISASVYDCPHISTR
ncbi:hypothetical protein J6590_071659 [Homalodisca vitripennis]|nr:hypothetical protein J6590_071659 [Homalodisca vitripennis]